MLVVWRWIYWPVRLPVAGTVVRQDAKVPRKIGQLCLPEPLVHNRPRGQEQDRRPVPMCAVHFVVDLYAVVVDEAVAVRLTGFHASPPCTNRGCPSVSVERPASHIRSEELRRTIVGARTRPSRGVTKGTRRETRDMTPLHR